MVLRRKLTTVQATYKASPFEKEHYTLLTLMSIYGIGLLADNTAECHANLVGILTDFLKVELDAPVARAARGVAEANIVQGDALSYFKPDRARVRGC
ncbi:hypothetical protein [Corynebacterium sp. CCM 9203]|uniref:hypothetical protein n=1 Tax=Corynebacterium sp. CCM 9203 TaxID=3057615 RepID=UPI0035251844